jgi:hypothetical protein
MANGQTYGSSRVDVSGRIAAIAIDPRNANHILVGSAAGGIWETRDRGASWSPRSDFAPTLTTGAIAFDPTAPATVYCGTGEGNWWARLGAGVMRSTDGGTTWTVIAGAPFVGQGFYDLVVDRTNRMHLLAGTTNGLYESANGGVTWTARRNARTWDLSMATARFSPPAPMAFFARQTAERRGRPSRFPARRQGASTASRSRTRHRRPPSPTRSARAAQRVSSGVVPPLAARGRP